jgi:transcriptional regulator with XRE-family HTH domain
VSPERAFGQVLRQHRQAHGWSQETLAFEAGIARNYVSLMERGINAPTIVILFKLAAALELSASALMSETERKATPPRRRLRTKT